MPFGGLQHRWEFAIHLSVYCDHGLRSMHSSGNIHELLSRRGLPDAQFERLWAGRGTHCCCEACGRTIAGDEIEYELEYRQGAQSLTVIMHRDCWEEWRQV